MTIIMIIEGHDIRYTGDGWRWDVPEGSHAKWSDLKRVGYTEKQCMGCGFKGAPDTVMPPCHEFWADRTGNPAWSGVKGEAVYWPLSVGA